MSLWLDILHIGSFPSKRILRIVKIVHILVPKVVRMFTMFGSWAESFQLGILDIGEVSEDTFCTS